MSAARWSSKRTFWLGMGTAAMLVAGYAPTAGAAEVTLSGSQEVPPVTTSASGKGTITVNDDKSVSGSITTTGVQGTAAHIHEAAEGKNGPVVVPLTKSGDTYSVAPGAKLNDEQYAAYKAGNLYVNVHSDAHKGGEVRAQIKP
jgi:CHRD domain-containing protein